MGARRPGQSALGELASPVYSTVVLTVCAGFGALALWRTHTAAQEAAAREAADAKRVAAQAASEAAPEPESFEAAVDRCFGETLRLDDFMLSLTSVLRECGFTRDNTLTTLSLPRDPLMSPVREQLQKLWGDGVCLSSLSGLPLLGHTGLRAACGAHGSNASGWRQDRRTLIVACAHIAVAADGTIGECDVLGQDASRSMAHACSVRAMSPPCCSPLWTRA
eukprot:COSAG02_NODE_964_length_15595_cov_7.284709_6_plen_221_part_00